MNLKNILNTGVIGIVVAVFGIFVPIIWGYFYSLANISVYRKSSTEIVKDNIGAGENLEITYNGSNVNHLNISLFVVENTGNKPIKSEDVVSPLRVYYEGHVTILEAQVIDQNPKNLGAKVKVLGSDVVVEQTLLNKGDSIAFKIVSSGDIRKIGADARIANISEVDFVDQASLLSSKVADFYLKDFILLLLLLLLLLAFLGMVGETRQIRAAVIDTFKSQFIYEMSPEKIDRKILEFLRCGLLTDELENFRRIAIDISKKEKSDINEMDKASLRKSIPVFHTSFKTAIFTFLFSILIVYSVADVLLVQARNLLGI